jgi:hypothetical protein
VSTTKLDFILEKLSTAYLAKLSDTTYRGLRRNALSDACVILRLEGYEVIELKTAESRIMAI